MNKKIKFFSPKHKEAFRVFLEEADFNNQSMPKDLLGYRQIAFLYLLALYQEDYKKYEGIEFYVEDFGELSLGGPTYLLEENLLSSAKYEHEKILKIAVKILKGTLEKDDYIHLPIHMIESIQVALDLSIGLAEKEIFK